MGLIALAVVVEVGMFVAVIALKASGRSSRRRQLQRFEEAAAQAKRLAHDALIVDASIAELSELVIEESLREMGMAWDTEGFSPEEWAELL